MRVRILAVASLVAVAGACVIQRPVIQQLEATRLTQSINFPVKAHLKDGSTVLYPNGVAREGDDIVGIGNRFQIGDATESKVFRLPLDSVAGMESFGRHVEAVPTVIASVFATAGATVAAAGLAIAIFGSCPTIYADSAGTELLQAETFSYAIAPLFEQRDVDRLRLTATPDGKVVLHIRNEMLETHYINHLELIEARHSPNEEIVPDQTGQLLAIANDRLAASVGDRSGRDVSAIVRSVDKSVFSTIDARLASVTVADLDDYIDIKVSVPESNDSVAVQLDMRNSLLNTVLLYDHILGAPGLKSLEYLEKDVEQISKAVDVGRWYAANMGMRVSVLDHGTYRRVARIADAGPIAFHRMAVLVPAIRSDDGLVHVRLSFTADNWRIDQLGVATSWRRPPSRTIPAARVTMPNPAQETASQAALAHPDEAYLITSPGQSFSAEFDVGSAKDEERTWFIASQGYYTEWVRGDWIKNASGKPFIPTNEVLIEAIRGWRSKQKSMENSFYTQRIAAR